MSKLHFILLFALAGCEPYGVGGAGYGYGGGPAYYNSGRGDYGPERQERRWQNQGAQEQRNYNAPPPRQAPPPSPSPSVPSAAVNRKALENLGFRPN